MREDLDLFLRLNDEALLDLAATMAQLRKVVHRLDHDDGDKLLLEDLLASLAPQILCIDAEVAHVPLNLLLKHLLTIEDTVNDGMTLIPLICPFCRQVFGQEADARTVSVLGSVPDKADKFKAVQSQRVSGRVHVSQVYQRNFTPVGERTIVAQDWIVYEVVR